MGINCSTLQKNDLSFFDWKYISFSFIKSLKKEGRGEEEGMGERMRLPYFSWNCRKPGLTWGLAFSREVVASGELAGRLGMEAGI